MHTSIVSIDGTERHLYGCDFCGKKLEGSKVDSPAPGQPPMWRPPLAWRYLIAHIGIQPVGQPAIVCGEECENAFRLQTGQIPLGVQMAMQAAAQAEGPIELDAADTLAPDEDIDELAREADEEAMLAASAD